MTPDNVLSGEVAAWNLVAFTRSLRDAGFAVTPSTTRDLVEAARIVGMHAGRDIRAAFSAVVVTRHAQIPRFNEIFDQFFSGEVVYRLDDVVDRLGSTGDEIRSPRISVAPAPESQKKKCLRGLLERGGAGGVFEIIAHELGG